ncbi:MAG TPA: carboxypeptidase regulatory-like domain-containing protein [Myxococcales bacterium]|nr:carboxypeptidase regulatory-like domain-containing protein [Myxococcales bacterium]
MAAIVFMFLRIRQQVMSEHFSPARPASLPPRESQASTRAFDQRPAVTLAPGSSKSQLPAPSGAFEGRVVSALTGKGLPGAQLTFARNEETSSVIASAEGAFRFEARAAGRWFLAAATANGHQPFAPEWGQSPIQLDARPGETVRGITVALLPVEELQGRVVDLEKKPVAEAEITVLGGGVGTSVLTPLTTHYRSGADGTFTFSAPEEATIEARHEGFATGRASVDYAVHMSHKLTIQLKPASEPLLAIEGVVEDAAGAPAEGVSVSASRSFMEAGAIARSDAQGRFKLAELTGGTWRVIASKPGAAPAIAEAQAGTAGLRLRLLQGGRLAGRVTEKHGGPVRLFSLLVVQPGLIQSLSFIDPDGRYQIEGLQPGEATVSAIAPGQAPASNRRVTIPEPGAAAAQLDFELTTGGKLTGSVVERGTGKPLAGADVSVEGTSASQGVPIRNQTLTGADGKFALDALEETKLGIIASADGHHGRILSVPPIADGDTGGPVNIELTPLQPGEDPQVELTGIGATLSKQGDALAIGLTPPGGGAAEAGLGPGDRIVAADGASLASLTLGEAIQLLRGPEGTTVTLSVIKSGTAQTINVAVTRRLIRG